MEIIRFIVGSLRNNITLKLYYEQKTKAQTKTHKIYSNSKEIENSGI